VIDTNNLKKNIENVEINNRLLDVIRDDYINFMMKVRERLD